MSEFDFASYITCANFALNHKKTILSSVKGFFSKDKKPEVISPVLAVGYFYNFITPISNEISNGKTFILKKENAENETIESDKTKIKLVIPSSLSIKSFKMCEDEVKSKTRGVITSDARNRGFGINYSISADKELTILDYVRPITVIKFYYEEILKFDIKKDEEKWNKIQGGEILAFVESIKTMLEKGNGLLTNKIEFVNY